MADKSNKVKIFVGYYKPNKIFKSDVYQPILTADTDWDDAALIKDNSGINIAEKNKNYGELSGHYWVWKNFIPKTDCEYIGFCHYRRFLDFNISPIESIPFKPVYEKDFKKRFKQYSEDKILEFIENFDIILPVQMEFKSILYSQYLKWHPKKDMNLALNIIRDIYPEYIETTKEVMGSKKMYTCLNFIMKKELLEKYFEWIFSILEELEKRTNWLKYKEYLEIRTPAFITERFFNIWLAYNIKKYNLKIKTSSSLFIVGEDYGEVNPEIYFEKYNAIVDLMKQDKI